MPDIETRVALLAVAALLAKHFLMDFVFQTEFQWRNKGIYGHPGGLIHAGLHTLGTAPILLLAGTGATALAAILVTEFVVHYHVDWLRERILRRTGWRYDTHAYWEVLGADQLTHGLTYVAIVWVMVRVT